MGDNMPCNSPPPAAPAPYPPPTPPCTPILQKRAAEYLELQQRMKALVTEFAALRAQTRLAEQALIAAFPRQPSDTNHRLSQSLS